MTSIAPGRASAPGPGLRRIDATTLAVTLPDDPGTAGNLQVLSPSGRVRAEIRAPASGEARVDLRALPRGAYWIAVPGAGAPAGPFMRL